MPGNGCHGQSWDHVRVRIEHATLAGVAVLVPTPFRDERGFFTRTFDADIFDAWVGVPGTSATFVQDSQSRSDRAVVRGMHGRGGRGEAKLVRCANGAILDVLVDARPDSPTFGQHEAFTLDDNDFRHLYVPPGLLHGFQVLTDTADVCYR
ncbi:MAG: dTDP-4-dehydrorhamnose 3,5-epimerase, partial [Mycobacterium sp.]|nr:dTDP-4-dehydrorhamnose 3,5-epimerase [Mycobacterium sp.]